MFEFVAQSEWSRSQFIEIGDLEEQAALKFLTNRRVEENVALDAIHTFLGGRIIDLQTAAYEYNNGSESSMQSQPFIMQIIMCHVNAFCSKLHFFVFVFYYSHQQSHDVGNR